MVVLAFFQGKYKGFVSDLEKNRILKKIALKKYYTYIESSNT